MKRICLFCFCVFLSISVWSETYSMKVERIWEGDYCAFTSLIKYKGVYYCAFREATAHHFDANNPTTAGRIRVIASKNGKRWKSVVEFAQEGIDLRDPKLSEMSDGRMMLLFGGAYVNRQGERMLEPKVVFSDDGKHFGPIRSVELDPSVRSGHEWLWRVTWHKGVGYGVIYGSHFALMQTIDGVHYHKIVDLGLHHFPNETTIRFLSDDTMLMLVRTEEDAKHGMWGISRPPYTDWQWEEMNIILGGPNFLVLNDTTLVVGTRALYGSEKMMMLKGRPDGKFEEVCLLPSGGDDNSYPGMWVEGDKLWVTYYSRHETPKASIYLARMPLQWFLTQRTNQYYKKKW